MGYIHRNLIGGSRKPHAIYIMLKAIVRFLPRYIFFGCFLVFSSVLLTQIFCSVQIPKLSFFIFCWLFPVPSSFRSLIYCALWHFACQHSLALYDLSTIIFSHPVICSWFSSVLEVYFLGLGCCISSLFLFPNAI